MFVSDFALNDYRSYRQLVVQLPPGMVVFLGRNGRGKTNLVEAVSYLSTFSSHRVSADRALLRQGNSDSDSPSAAVIRARVNYGAGSRLYELEIVQGKANRARINRGQVPPRELLGQLRTVMFAPEDLQLLRGDPGERRRFLDEVVTQLKPSFISVRRDFDRVLRQRAAALKQVGRMPGMDPQLVEDSLAAWDQALVHLSAEIAAHRLVVTQALKPYMSDYYEQVSSADKPVDIRYHSKLEDQEKKHGLQGTVAAVEASGVIDGGYIGDISDLVTQFRDRYQAVIAPYRTDELRRAVNLVGAHRDDLDLSLHGLPVKGYASQGETWSVVLALRLAEKDLLSTDDDTPVLILDDVFAELDEGRREALADSIKDVEQVLITAAVASDLPDSLSGATYRITWDPESGSIVENSQ